jgi:hypothetical protein
VFQAWRKQNYKLGKMTRVDNNPFPTVLNLFSSQHCRSHFVPYNSHNPIGYPPHNIYTDRKTGTSKGISIVSCRCGTARPEYEEELDCRFQSSPCTSIVSCRCGTARPEYEEELDCRFQSSPLVDTVNVSHWLDVAKDGL